MTAVDDVQLWSKVFDYVKAELWPEPDTKEREEWNARLALQAKQQKAEDLSAECDALLYGGAAGGGKTHWLLCHMGRQMLEYPGNRGVIFRRVFPSLNRTIIPRARQLYKGWATENKTEHIFYFHNGSILELGTLQYESSVENYQGAEYGVIAFEEITEFTEAQFDYFKSRLRPPVEGPKPHLIATTNPGGVGHKWVKKEWVKPPADDVLEGDASPMTVWRAAPKGLETPMTRCFVPATLQDNQILMERDPSYINKLRAITNAKKRKAYMSGDWDAIEEVEGALWTQRCLDEGRRREHPSVARRIIAIDPSSGTKAIEEAAKNDGFGVTVAVLGNDNHAYVTFNEEWHQPAHIMAKRVIELYHDERADKIVIERNHGGNWIPALFKTLDRNVYIDTVWASDGKRTRAEPAAALFYEQFGFPATAHLVGVHPELEEELTNFTGMPGEPSPDRLDSMVWAIWELLLGEHYGDPEIEDGDSEYGTIMGDLLTKRF